MLLPSISPCQTCNSSVSELVYTCDHSVCKSCTPKHLLLKKIDILESDLIVNLKCSCGKGNLELTYEQTRSYLSDKTKPVFRKCNEHHNYYSTLYCTECKLQICQAYPLE